MLEFGRFCFAAVLDGEGSFSQVGRITLAFSGNVATHKHTRTPRTHRNARSVHAGLAARTTAEEESERAVARWEAALRAGEVDDRVRKEELKAVEKLEVLLKVGGAGRRWVGRGRRQPNDT